MLACNPGNQQKDNNVSANLPNLAYTYGRNVGLAFQLIDDWLDFMASAEQLGILILIKLHDSVEQLGMYID